MPEELGIDLVHGGKVTTIFQEDRTLDHVGHFSIAARQNQLDVFERAPGLVLHLAEAPGGGAMFQFVGSIMLIGEARLSRAGLEDEAKYVVRLAQRELRPGPESLATEPHQEGS